MQEDEWEIEKIRIAIDNASISRWFEGKKNQREKKKTKIDNKAIYIVRWSSNCSVNVRDEQR